MKVLVFAYRGEAQAFMEGYQLSKVMDGLYVKNPSNSKSPAIFFSKEGVESTIFRMTKLMQTVPEITEVINLGIVGGLLKSLKPLDILEIHTAYCHLEGDQTRHQSFVLDHDTEYPHTCMTSHMRVFDTSQKEYLSKFADVVDRELWAIAYVLSNYAKVSLKSVKCIADASEDPLECKEIIENSKRYSKALRDYYIKNFEESHIVPCDSFDYVMTRTQSVLYNKYSTKLLSDWGEKTLMTKKQEFMNQLPSKMHPKQRTKPLLEWMEKAAYPELVALKKQAKEILEPLKSDQSSFSYDERLDHPAIDFKYQINSQKDFENLKNTVNHFDYSKWLRFFGRP